MGPTGPRFPPGHRLPGGALFLPGRGVRFGSGLPGWGAGEEAKRSPDGVAEGTEVQSHAGNDTAALSVAPRTPRHVWHAECTAGGPNVGD